MSKASKDKLTEIETIIFDEEDLIGHDNTVWLINELKRQRKTNSYLKARMHNLTQYPKLAGELSKLLKQSWEFYKGRAKYPALEVRNVLLIDEKLNNEEA